jgi:predicted RNase H-like HicB family nuclease
MTKVLNYRVIVEQDEDGVFVASVPNIPGCHSQGDTYEESIKNIKEVINLCLDVANEFSDYKSKINYIYNGTQTRFLGVTEVAIQI